MLPLAIIGTLRTKTTSRRPFDYCCVSYWYTNTNLIQCLHLCNSGCNIRFCTNLRFGQLAKQVCTIESVEMSMTRKPSIHSVEGQQTVGEFKISPEHHQCVDINL